MSSAQKLFRAFIRALENNDYRYDVVRQGTSPVVAVSFDHRARPGRFNAFMHVGTEELPQMSVYTVFDANGEEAHFQTSPLVSVNQDMRQRAINVCNEINTQQRWVKFDLDETGAIVGHYDLLLPDSGAGDMYMRVMRRIAKVVDDAVPKLVECLAPEAVEGEDSTDDDSVA